jgi:hypothetical protein
MLGFDTEEITTFFGAIKDGDFDYLLGSAPQPDVQ